MVNDTDFAPWRDPAATPLIRCRGVTKRFGEFTAIDALDLDIYPREFFALLGPSGCGKTTLMRMLGGFETVTEGTIEIDGQDMAGIAPNKRAVNMMFQSYALFPHLSVERNIAFGLEREGMEKGRIAERVDEMIRLTQLGPLRARKPHQISGGQRQRVALARSLAKAPKLLLLDEPLGALDRKLREETQFELMDIQEKTGTTFVIVTHDQEEAMTVATRVAVMREGGIEQVDTPDVIYEAPVSRYVADFIGDVNLVSGTATRAEPREAPPATEEEARPGIGARLAAATGFVTPAEATAPARPAAGTAPSRVEITWAEGQPPLLAEGTSTGAVTLAIRPEKVTISKDRPATANAIEGQIVDIGYLGNSSTYHVRVADGTTLKATEANTRRISNRSFTWDDAVWLGWSETAGVVLDR